MKRFIISVGALLTLFSCITGCAEKQPTENLQTEQKVEDLVGTSEKIVNSILDTCIEVYSDEGYPYFSPNKESSVDKFDKFLGLVEAKGTGVSFDRSSISKTRQGLSVTLSAPLDSYGNNIVAWFEYTNVKDKKFALSVSSMGEDGVMQFTGSHYLSTEQATDDIYKVCEGTVE